LPDVTVSASRETRIHVARVGNEWAVRFSEALERDAVAGVDGVIATDAADAHVVLLATAAFSDPDDWWLRSLRSSPIFTEHRDKLVVYDERDRPWCWAPGVYVSMPQPGFRSEYQIAGSYLGIEDERFVPLRTAEPDLLVSFIGNATHRCRRPLFEIADERALVRDISGEDFLFWRDGAPNFETIRTAFDEAMARSKFVLCPRGHGTSSIRLFETMAAGRVPVIISDDWVAPPGPDWSSCSLRLAEGDTEHLLQRLEAAEVRHEAMARAARDAFDTYFARGPRLRRLIGAAAKLVDDGTTRTAPRGGVRDRYFVERWARHTAGRARGAIAQRRLTAGV
jgi:hypothetical protein